MPAVNCTRCSAPVSVELAIAFDDGTVYCEQCASEWYERTFGRRTDDDGEPIEEDG